MRNERFVGWFWTGYAARAPGPDTGPVMAIPGCMPIAMGCAGIPIARWYICCPATAMGTPGCA